MIKEEGEFWYLYFIMFAVYYTIKIVLIWACDSGKDQAAKIGIIVHNLLNSTSDKQIKDEVGK